MPDFKPHPPTGHILVQGEKNRGDDFRRFCPASEGRTVSCPINKKGGARITSVRQMRNDVSSSFSIGAHLKTQGIGSVNATKTKRPVRKSRSANEVKGMKRRSDIRKGDLQSGKHPSKPALSLPGEGRSSIHLIEEVEKDMAETGGRDCLQARIAGFPS